MRNVSQSAGKPQRFSLKARWRSVGSACCGLREVMRSEHNARIHVVCALGVVCAGVWVGLRIDDWRWIALVVALVWAAEALNTAVEAVCDAVSAQFHPQIQRAKDIAAGAVLICAVAALVIGGLTFWPYLAG